jgi:hypothetical protein
MKIKVTIQGKTPLLMNRFSEEQLESSQNKDKNATPREMAEIFAYRDKNGELCIPGICIFASIIDAGKFSKKGKNKITTMKSSLIPAGVSLEEEECLLGTKEFEVDSRSVVVPATGGRIMRHRPRLDEWKVKFTLEIDKNEFSEKEVRKFVDDAGNKCGLLAYRPNRKGWFGKFDVIHWDIIEK